jgi:hypothetical protein
VPIIEETPAPYKEFVSGGLHHIATLAGPQSQLSPTYQILPFIEQAAAQGEAISVDIQPIASTSQVEIQPTMAAPIQINTQTFGQQGAPAQTQGTAQGQQQQAAPQAPVQVAATNGGALKGNPPIQFTGERSKSRGFLNAFNLYKETNCHNEAMRNPYSCVTTALTYMTDDLMES